MIRNFIGYPEFSDKFNKIVVCVKPKGYNIDITKQTAGLAVDPIMVDHFAYLFNCSPDVGIQTVQLSRLKSIH